MTHPIDENLKAALAESNARLEAERPAPKPKVRRWTSGWYVVKRGPGCGSDDTTETEG